MSGNGIDYQAMYDMIVQMVGDLRALNARVGSLGHDVTTLRADMANVRGDLASVRGEIAHYHGSVVGHGILITELDERVRRIERRLEITSA